MSDLHNWFKKFRQEKTLPGANPGFAAVIYQEELEIHTSRPKASAFLAGVLFCPVHEISKNFTPFIFYLSILPYFKTVITFSTDSKS